MNSENTIIDERTESYFPFDSLDESKCYWHKKAGLTPTQSIGRRLRTAEYELHELLKWTPRHIALYGDEYEQMRQRCHSLIDHLETAPYGQ